MSDDGLFKHQITRKGKKPYILDSTNILKIWYLNDYTLQSHVISTIEICLKVLES